MNFESQQDKRIRQLQSDLSMAPLLATLRKEAEALSQGRHSITLENTANLDLLGSPKDLHSAQSNLVSNAVRYADRRAHHHSLGTRWRQRQLFGDRHRLRHPRRSSGAPHRALLPRVVQSLARQRRHRPGAFHRQARAGSASGAAGYSQHTRPWLHLHLRLGTRTLTGAGNARCPRRRIRRRGLITKRGMRPSTRVAMASARIRSRRPRS